MTTNDIIIANLAYLRKLKRLTEESVAKVIGVSRSAYSNYESGKRTINIDALIKLAEFYGVTLDLITSSGLIEGYQPSLKFNALKYKEDGSLEFADVPLSITNNSSNIIALKVDDYTVKVFETTMTHIKNHEMLFEYKGKLQIGVVHFNYDGSGIITSNNNPPVYFPKQDKNQVVFLAALLANIDKEINSSNFF